MAAKKKLILWLEINSPLSTFDQLEPLKTRDPAWTGSTTYKTAVEQVLLQWSYSGMPALITTQPHYYDATGSFPIFRPYNASTNPYGLIFPPGMTIYAGFKPSTLSPIDDANDWLGIADMSSRFRSSNKLSPEVSRDVCCFENETTIMGPLEAGFIPAWGKLERGLRALSRTGVTIWWNLPRILPNQLPLAPQLEAVTRRFLKTVRRSCRNSVVFDATRSYNAAPSAQATLLEPHTRDVMGPSRIQRRAIVSNDGQFQLGDGTMHAKAVFTPTLIAPADPNVAGVIDQADVLNVYFDFPRDALIAVNALVTNLYSRGIGAAPPP